MEKRDVPMFVALLIASAVGFLSSKGYEPYAYGHSFSGAEIATASRSLPTTGVTVPEKPKKPLDFYAGAKGLTTPVTLNGRIEAYYSESKKFEETDAPLKFALIVGRERYEVKNLNGELPARIDGATVSLSGYVSGKSGKKELLVSLSPAELRNIRGTRYQPNLGGSRSGSMSLDCVDSYCALVIPVDMTGNTSGLPAPTDIQAHIFGGAITDALSQESYGAVDYSGDVTDWVEVPQETLNVFSFPAEVEQYLLSNNINPAQYDQVVMLVNGGSQSYGGESSIGPTYVSFNGGSVYMPLALVGFAQYQNNGNLTASNGNLSYFDYLYVHETGHSMNALHDNMYSCKSGPISLPSECMNVEYGNKYSMMGDGSYGGHFSFWQKLRAGWIAMPPLTSSGTYAFNNGIEVQNPTVLGVDGNTNAVPEFVMERRTSTGLDAQNLFTGLNLNGAFLYRMKNWSDPNTTSDPATWDLGLIDTTPHLQSARWFDSMNDVVFKEPQRYVDRQNLVQFAQQIGGGSNSVLVNHAQPVANACTRNPVKVFEPYVNTGDTFTNQIPQQKWPVRTGMPSVAESLVQDIHADVNDPSAQVLLYKYFMMFNDDYIACGPGQYSIEMLSGGQPLSLITESNITYNPWSGPLYNMTMAFMPVYGMQYGHHTVTLKITKLNDGSIFSRDLVFNLVP